MSDCGRIQARVYPTNSTLRPGAITSRISYTPLKDDLAQVDATIVERPVLPSATVPLPGGSPRPSGMTSMSRARISSAVAGRPMPSRPGCGLCATATEIPSTISAAAQMAARPDTKEFLVAPGTVEQWVLRNGSDNQHVFHVHGVSFTVIEYGGGAPPPQLRGLKDSVLLARGTTVRVAVRFRGSIDAQAPYMFHCHVLAHEDRGMMGQFVLVGGDEDGGGEGEERRAARPHDHRHDRHDRHGAGRDLHGAVEE